MTTTNELKVGDIINRKDMPELKSVIIGEDKTWKAWRVKIMYGNMNENNATHLVFKDDERWTATEKASREK